MRARVLGMGLWMPGFPDAQSWLSGRGVAGVDTPNAQSKQRRRSSLLVNMVADVAAQASADAGVPVSRLRVVVGSAFGELTTLVEMLEERERTLYWLSKKTGVRWATIWQMGKGEVARLNMEALDRICEALECQPGDLLVRVENRKARKRGKR